MFSGMGSAHGFLAGPVKSITQESVALHPGLAIQVPSLFCFMYFGLKSSSRHAHGPGVAFSNLSLIGFKSNISSPANPRIN
jgi:hypothetical protein